jgi:hypothetical protein
MRLASSTMRHASFVSLLSAFAVACSGDMTFASPDASSSGGADAAFDAPPGAADAAPGAADASSGAQPGDGLMFLDFPEQRPADPRAAGDGLQDIARHLPSSYGDEYYFDDQLTWAHETTHGINAELRNNYNTTGKPANGFYVMQNRGVIIIEPNCRKSDANAYVPMSLRGFRYDTYLAGQEEWEDTPTYLFDEWVAYTNQAVVGVELVQRGLYTSGGQDGVYGAMEFVTYAMALGMAVRDKDPSYFQSYPQFREFLAWNAKRAMQAFRAGHALQPFQFSEQETYFDTLRTAPSAQPIRDFIVQTYGQAFEAELLAPL